MEKVFQQKSDRVVSPKLMLSALLLDLTVAIIRMIRIPEMMRRQQTMKRKRRKQRQKEQGKKRMGVSLSVI